MQRKRLLSALAVAFQEAGGAGHGGPPGSYAEFMKQMGRKEPAKVRV